MPQVVKDRGHIFLPATKRGELTGQRELRHIPFAGFELRTDGDKAPHFTGYATLFEQPYRIADYFGDYQEVISRGAFAASLAAKADVRLLINHDGLPLARTASGTLQLVEDRTGLKVDADLDATDPDVARLLPKMARGDLGEMSFAFMVRKQQWTWASAKDQPDERRLLELDIDDGDVSIVTYPANPATSASIRAAQFKELSTGDSPLLRIAALIQRGADLAEHGDLLNDAHAALAAIRGTPIDRGRHVDLLRRELDLAAIA